MCGFRTPWIWETSSFAIIRGNKFGQKLTGGHAFEMEDGAEPSILQRELGGFEPLLAANPSAAGGPLACASLAIARGGPVHVFLLIGGAVREPWITTASRRGVP